MENEIEQNTYGTIEIKYTRPKFIHRVLANLVDFIVFALVFVGLFSLTRYLVSLTPTYQSAYNTVNAMRLESGLYVLDGSTYKDIVSYMDSDNSFDSVKRVKTSESTITKFFTFEEKEVSETRYQEILTNYDELRLASTLVNDKGDAYFVEVEGEIVKNPAPSQNITDYEYYNNFYKNYIDNKLQGFLAVTPRYYDATKVMNNYLIYLDISVSFVLAVILVYYVPTLCFRRGRKTLGKALYHIGTVDSRYLSPTFLRNTAKWSLFLLEMILGVASLGIIFILSFTLMAFSKLRQGFPDYMLHLQEVDTSKENIYMNYTEIQLRNVNSHKKPSDFRMKDGLD